MISLKIYAALGEQVEIRGEDAIVRCGDQERILNQQELLIWLSLMWRISTFTDLYRNYCVHAAAIKLCPEADFYACLQRLLQRGLVQEGTGYTYDEALYNLLAPLFICPLHNTFIVKALAFLGMLCQRRTLHEAKLAFSCTALTRFEKRILNLSKRLKMSTVEIIRCLDCGVGQHGDESAITKVLYADSFLESALSSAASRASPRRQEVLGAVDALYSKQKIVFQAAQEAL